MSDDMKKEANPFPSTMHCPHGEFALKHLGGGAYGTSCQQCNPKGELVALLCNSAGADAIVAKQANAANWRTYTAAGTTSKRITEVQLEKLGRLVDRIDNLVCAGAIPMRDEIRVKALSEALPDLHSKLKALYVEIAGEDPWLIA